MGCSLTAIPKPATCNSDAAPIGNRPCHGPAARTVLCLVGYHLADWTSFKDFTGPVHYPGRVVAEADLPKSAATNDADLGAPGEEAKQVFNKQKLAKLMEPAIQKAKELKLPLYCGEFGCLPHVERADRLKYYDDIISVFEENGIAWCNWEYKGDFGILTFDFKKKVSGSPDTGFIDVLMRKRQPGCFAARRSCNQKSQPRIDQVRHGRNQKQLPLLHEMEERAGERRCVF